MDKINIGLLGVILIITSLGVYQTNSLKAEITDLKTDLNAKLTTYNATTKSDVNTNNNTLQNNQNLNNNSLPSVETLKKGPTTNIKFAEEVHNYGSVEVESENLHSFSFTNTGSEPLIISDAKGSCGCTVPNWPKDPIMPGQSGNIDVKFTPNAGQAGQEIEKVVTVTANTNPENTMVRIKANVIAK
jgi:hypothetical protein